MGLIGQRTGPRPESDLAPAPDRGHRKRPPSPVSVAMTLAGRPAIVALAIGLLLLGAGITGVTLANHSAYHPPHVAAPKPVLPPVGHAQTPPPETADQSSPPVSLTIPVIGVRASIIHLGLTKTGALQVPGSTAVAGWYTGSPPPGAIGSSIIAGHVDSLSGPGVFYHLGQLHAGDRVYVKEKDGQVAVFGVNTVHEYSKNIFPTLKVYGPTPTSQLRLITCGGTFDSLTGHYLSNVVVYATLVP